MNAAPRRRDAGVDLMRFVMAIAVVSLHSRVSPVTVTGVPWATLIGEMIARGAVPFFFVAGGYFLDVERPLAEISRKYGARILPILAVWAFVYWIASGRLIPGHGMALAWLLNGGPGFPLWFLIGLLFGLVTVAAGVKAIGRAATFAVALGLAALALTFTTYHARLGVGAPSDLMVSVSRDALAPFFVLTGQLLRGRARTGIGLPLALVLGILALGIAEQVLIVGLPLGVPIHNLTSDVLVTTLGLGPALFLLARSIDGHVQRFGGLGGLSLSIYLVHLLFVWLLARHFGTGFVATFALASFLSIAAAAIMVRIPYVRRLVT